jgi:hypothetical protein
MSLKDQFVADVHSIFLNTEEHATTREFRIADGHGGFTTFTQDVVWDEEAAKEEPVVKYHGQYLCDVMCFLPSTVLPRRPLAGELIYSPANQPWEIMECTDQAGMFKLALMAHRSQPGFYGVNPN